MSPVRIGLGPLPPPAYPGTLTALQPSQAGVTFAEVVRVAHGGGASAGDVLLPDEGAGADHGVLEPVPGQFAREDNSPAHRELGEQTSSGLAEVYPHHQGIHQP